MATYTTPKLRCDHFDDWNPGRGLDTIAETAMYIRSHYGIPTVKLIQHRKAVQFRVSGREANVSAFADLYGEGNTIAISSATTREMRTVLNDLGYDATSAKVADVHATVTDLFGSLEKYLRQYSRR
jgi:hypothetical protein